MKKGRPAKELDIDDIFKKVINLVKKGKTIQKALESLNVDRALFYRRLSKECKLELKSLKVSNAIFSQPYTQGLTVSADLLRFNETVMNRFEDDDDEIF